MAPASNSRAAASCVRHETVFNFVAPPTSGFDAGEAEAEEWLGIGVDREA